MKPHKGNGEPYCVKTGSSPYEGKISIRKKVTGKLRHPIPRVSPLTLRYKKKKNRRKIATIMGSL